jgi:type I restriction enzyme S subunit
MKPYLRVANVFEDRIDTSDVKQMHFDQAEFERYRLHPGDLVLNEGQTPELLGRPAIYRGTPADVAFTNSLIRFQVRDGVDPRWALAVFRHHMHAGRFTRESRITTNIAHLSAARFKTVEFPVPPINEQRRIVEILEDHLSRLDAATASVLGVLRRTRVLAQTELQAVVTRESNGSCRLRDVVARIEAGRSFGGAAPPAGPADWGVIKVSAMTWGAFRPDENKVVPASVADARFEIRRGDLLVSRANTTAYVGASVLVEATRPRLLLSDKSLRLVPKVGVDPGWLAAVLATKAVRRQISSLATGTKESMRNVSQVNLLSVTIPVARPLQQAAVMAIRTALRERTARWESELQKAAKRSALLRRALLAAAFSGRLTGVRDVSEVVEELAGV